MNIISSTPGSSRGRPPQPAAPWPPPTGDGMDRALFAELAATQSAAAGALRRAGPNHAVNGRMIHRTATAADTAWWCKHPVTWITGRVVVNREEGPRPVAYLVMLFPGVRVYDIARLLDEACRAGTWQWCAEFRPGRDEISASWPLHMTAGTRRNADELAERQQAARTGPAVQAGPGTVPPRPPAVAPMNGGHILPGRPAVPPRPPAAYTMTRGHILPGRPADSRDMASGRSPSAGGGGA